MPYKWLKKLIISVVVDDIMSNGKIAHALKISLSDIDADIDFMRHELKSDIYVVRSELSSHVAEKHKTPSEIQIKGEITGDEIKKCAQESLKKLQESSL